MLKSGMEIFGVKPGDSPGVRYWRFEEWLCDMIPKYSIDGVVYEQVHHRWYRGKQAAQVLYGMVAILQKVIGVFDCCEHMVGQPSQIKHLATGNGRASKERVYEAALARIDWAEQLIKSQDQAEALWLLEWARGEYGEGRTILALDLGTKCGWALWVPERKE